MLLFKKRSSSFFVLPKNLLIRRSYSDDSDDKKDLKRSEKYDKKDIERSSKDKDIDDDDKKDMKEQIQEKGNKLKELFKKYGACGAFVYAGISLADFSFFYGLLSAGVDINGIVESLGFSLVGKSEKGITIAVAYAIHKIILPIRLGLAVYITPKVQPHYNKFVHYVKSIIKEKSD